MEGLYLGLCAQDRDESARTSTSRLDQRCEMGLFSAYVVAGAIYEAFRKATQTADLLLEIR
jgi:hypothetical protein